jgi:hypothetical protein
VAVAVAVAMPASENSFRHGGGSVVPLTLDSEAASASAAAHSLPLASLMTDSDSAAGSTWEARLESMLTVEVEKTFEELRYECHSS